ncbi:MAG TPA: hypothetical protein VEK57_02500 [Thermoanaerobaculia bacterium]|nr:hypothetical protein [Thermoanaerobaculia bacterium]
MLFAKLIIALLLALSLLDEGGMMDPNGGGAMDPNGTASDYTACIDPNG